MNEEVEKKYILDMVGNYSETVIDHARNPRNVGNIAKCDGFGQDEGECGDTLAVWLSVDKNRITNATFWTDGCGTSIACGSMVTEMAKGKTIDEALKISQKEIVDSLGGLPPVKIHCSVLAADALSEAIYNYLKKNKKTIPAELEKRHRRIEKERQMVEEKYHDWTGKQFPS